MPLQHVILVVMPANSTVRNLERDMEEVTDCVLVKTPRDKKEDLMLAEVMAAEATQLVCSIQQETPEMDNDLSSEEEPRNSSYHEIGD